MIPEIVILSGKGGTGKTSITAGLAQILSKTKKLILADCDTDASNLHQVLDPTVISREDFYSGKVARIKQDTCMSCGKCAKVCRFGAVETFNRGEQTRINSQKCEGCGVCDLVCYPTRSIVFKPLLCGETKVSQTKRGLLSHGALLPGGENSGHLVSAIRAKARELATQEQADLILIDGPPGIGCQSIASLTGTQQVLIVAEPTVSALHDSERVIELCSHFTIPAALSVNKADINPELADDIHRMAHKHGVASLPNIPYDTEVINAQLRGEAVTSTTSPASNALGTLAETFLNTTLTSKS